MTATPEVVITHVTERDNEWTGTVDTGHAIAHVRMDLVKDTVTAREILTDNVYSASFEKLLGRPLPALDSEDGMRARIQLSVTFLIMSLAGELGPEEGGSSESSG